MKQLRHPIVLLLDFAAILFTVFLIPISNFAQAAVPASPEKKAPTANTGPAKPTVAEAEKKLSALTIKASRASWVQSNFITDVTELLGHKDACRPWAISMTMIYPPRRIEQRRAWGAQPGRWAVGRFIQSV